MTDLSELLERASRTFALAIPLLPEPTRTDVTVAYLVFRIADTLEDADYLSTEEKVEGLEQLEQLLDQPTRSSAESFAMLWGQRRLTDNDWYQTLVQETPQVLEHLRGRELRVSQLIRLYARRTVLGMVTFLRRQEQHLQSLDELREYCYYVAGIVGELLTDIFTVRIDFFERSDDIHLQAKSFGEGLQLVNILRDSKEDLQCGRLFIPGSVGREKLFDLARQDLHYAKEYVVQLQRANAHPGYLAFTRLPLELANATLDLVEAEGPSAKISRAEVAQIMDRLHFNVTKLIH